MQQCPGSISNAPHLRWYRLPHSPEDLLQPRHDDMSPVLADLCREVVISACLVVLETADAAANLLRSWGEGILRSFLEVGSMGPGWEEVNGLGGSSYVLATSDHILLDPTGRLPAGLLQQLEPLCRDLPVCISVPSLGPDSLSSSSSLGRASCSDLSAFIDKVQGVSRQPVLITSPGFSKPWAGLYQQGRIQRLPAIRAFLSPTLMWRSLLRIGLFFLWTPTLKVSSIESSPPTVDASTASTERTRGCAP